LDVLRRHPRPLRFVLGRLLSRTGWCRRFLIHQPGYRLRFFPSNLAEQLWVDSTQRQHALAFFRRYLRAGDVVADVGANIGDVAIVCARTVGPRGRVHAFEPHPRVFDWLKQNINLNGLDNIQLTNAALGEHDGALDISNDRRDDMNRMLPAGGGISVPVRRLDEILEGTERIDLLKIDVEGFELFVLRGAEKVLARTQAVYVEVGAEHFRQFGYACADVFSLLMSSGFMLHRFRGDTEVEAISSNYMPVGVENIFAVRDAATLQARLHGSTISAIVTAYRRIPQALETIRRIRACEPPPREIVVHVDGNETATVDAIRTIFPDIQVIVSTTNVGPGGGRNKLLAECHTPYVASFDDDSYPMDGEYFARVASLLEVNPKAAVLAADVFHLEEKVANASSTPPRWVDSFPGGGCAYRRSMFFATAGYVPLAIAYGMEEVDLSLQLIDQGYQILHAPELRVFHDTDRLRHADPEVSAASIANIALLAYLRYPLFYWWLGLAQLASRVFWLLRVGRTSGVMTGLASIPNHLYANRHHRATVSVKCMKRARALRRTPEPATG
jgi:FkbM family methyltransferase